MGNVLVDNLKPGMTLNSDARDMTGRLLLRGGTVLSQENIRILKTREVAEVDIQGIEEEVAETGDTVQPDTCIADEAEKTAVNNPTLTTGAAAEKTAVNNSTLATGAALEKEISKEDDNKINIMRATAFFKPFTDRELPVILGKSSWLRYNSGDIILREGESSDPSFFVVLKGSICIQKRMGGTTMKKMISRLTRGECFGEMSLITRQARSADVVAEQETYVLKIDADTLNQETESFDLRSIQFKFYKAFSEILAQRLAYTDLMACKLT